MVATSSLSPSSLEGDATLFPSGDNQPPTETGAELLNSLREGLVEQLRGGNPETHLAFIPTAPLLAPVVTGAGATGTAVAAPVLLTIAAGLGLAAGAWVLTPEPQKAWLKSQTLNGARQLLRRAGLPEPEVNCYVDMIRAAFNQSNPVEALKALAAEWNRVPTATPSRPKATTRPRTPAASSAPSPIVSEASSTVKSLQQAIRNFDHARRTAGSADDRSARVALNHATAQAKTFLLPGRVDQLPSTIRDNLIAFIQQATVRLYPSSVAVPAGGSLGGSKVLPTIPDSVRQAVERYIAQNTIPKSESGQQDPLEEILERIMGAQTAQEVAQALEALRQLAPDLYAQLVQNNDFKQYIRTKLRTAGLNDSQIEQFLTNAIRLHLTQAQVDGFRAYCEELVAALQKINDDPALNFLPRPRSQEREHQAFNQRILDVAGPVAMQAFQLNPRVLWALAKGGVRKDEEELKGLTPQQRASLAQELRNVHQTKAQLEARVRQHLSRDLELIQEVLRKLNDPALQETMRAALDREPKIKGKYTVLDIMRAYKLYQNDSLEDVIHALSPNLGEQTRVGPPITAGEEWERWTRVQAAIEVLKKGDIWPVAPGLVKLFWPTESGN